jgi:hypothetical protein
VGGYADARRIAIKLSPRGGAVPRFYWIYCALLVFRRAGFRSLRPDALQRRVGLKAARRGGRNIADKKFVQDGARVWVC